jgi:hypothetical protein
MKTDKTQQPLGVVSDLNNELDATTELWSIYIPAIDLHFAMQDKETAEKECAEYDKNIREYYKDKKPVAFDLDDAFGLVQKWPHSDEMHKEDLANKSWQRYE